MDSSVAQKEGRRRALIESVWLRGGLLIALVEGVLILVGVIPRWPALVVSGVVLVAYFLRGRRVSSPSLRQTLWMIAVSQALVLFVPLLLWILKALAIVAIAAIAAAVLFVLLLDR